MGNRFEVQVVALDRFTNVFRKLNDGASRSVRPLMNVQRQVGALSKELHFDSIAKGMRNVQRSSLGIARNLGAISGPMETLFGLGAAGSFTAAGAAIVGIGASWGRLGFNIDRTSTAIGVSTRDLQLWRGAAGLAGVSAESMDAGLQGVGRTMQDAFAGRNQLAFVVMNRLGIEMKRLKDGTPDVVSAMDQIADVIAKIGNPYTRDIVASSLGIPPEMIPLLMKGADGLRQLRAEQEKLGIASAESLAKTEAFEKALFRLNAAGKVLEMTIGNAVLPTMTRLLDLMNRQASSVGQKGILGNLGDLFSGRLSWNAWSGPGTASGVATGGRRPLSAGAGSDPIGLRLHNPGNLMNVGGKGFQSFADDATGLGAMGRQLDRYYNHYGLHSISSIIGRYASGNYPGNTAATEAGYIADVSKSMGVAPHEELELDDPKQMASLMKAMVKHEQGKQPFSDQAYAQAAQSIKVDVSFANAPAGTQVQAKSGNTFLPTRVSYSMPTSTTP